MSAAPPPEPEPLECDAPECAAAPAYVCGCSRCAREPADEKFYACRAHRHEAAARHERVRGRAAFWLVAPPAQRRGEA